MRFDIDIDAIKGGGWTVQIRGGGTALLAQPRVLGYVGEGPLAFPLPPKGEADSLAARPAAEAIHRDLCNAVDSKHLSEAYASVVGRAPGDRGVERFGRYLFACVLGDQTWSEFYQRAAQEPIELAIGWRADDRAINRLPWETLHGPKKFLAQEPMIAITRRVRGTGRRIEPLEGLPRVLFVVGSELTNDVISPGAEFVGLLRSLRVANLDVRLKSHLLLEATPKKLAEAIKWFRPNVVHFICHGEWDPKGEFVLRLMDDDKPNEPFLMRAWNLETSLKAAGALPEMVVLNACFSANARDDYRDQPGDFKQPLAVQLVEMGVPVVVGMAGEVSDQACRMFTRRFYEALLKGEEFTHAAAEGRRVGIIGKSSYDPKSSVDWSLPVLFLATDLNEMRLSIPEKVLEREQQINKAAKDYATREDYPVFCGRLNFFHWYDVLMADRNVQQATSRTKREFQMLAVSVNLEDRAKELPGERYGRTWLLHELAMQMASDGHVPVLLTSETVPKTPNTNDELMTAIKKLALKTAERFGVDWNWKVLPQLEAMKKGDAVPPDLPSEIKNLLPIGGPEDPDVRAAAFRFDLLALREAVISSYECMPKWRRERTRLVLLLDDLHLYGEAAEYLTQTLLGSAGLRGAPNEIRVVGAYSSKPTNEQKTAAEQITRWVANSWVEDQPLSAFSAPEDRFAYRHFLLRYRENNRKNGQYKPLALAVGLRPELVDHCFKKLHKVTKGVPSNLKSEAVQNEIDEMLIELPKVLREVVLRDANDDDDLATLSRNRDLGP